MNGIVKNWFGTAAAVFLLLCLPVSGKAAETGILEIPVSVLAEGSEPDWDAVYTLELTALGEDCPMPEGSREGAYRMAVKGGSTGTIRLNCDKMGDYGYSLRQIPGKDPACTYDARQFRLHLTVTEEGKTVSIHGPEGETVTDILFRNRWAEPAWVTFSAWSTLDDRTPEEGSFRFLLLGEDGMTVAESRNQGRNVMFPALRFAREGIRRYELKEAAVAGDGIIYDRAVYTLTVAVRLEGDYKAEVSILRNGKAYAGMPCFVNYTKDGPPKTGDGIGIWVAGMVLSGIVLAALWKKRYTCLPLGEGGRPKG